LVRFAATVLFMSATNVAGVHIRKQNAIDIVKMGLGIGSQMSDSLEGFRVVDLTEGICGPFCSMQLADAGAEVIKVEPPKGDYARQIGPPFVNRESAVFLSLNRSKKSVVLDYRREDQCSILNKLVATADIFLEDLGPGEAERLGLGYSQLSASNRRLVYCAISAFGEEGPLKNLPGCELVIQAMAEYTASLGRIGDPPIRVGADVACINTGIFATQAILAALFHRQRTGQGQRVAVSQFGSLLHMRGIMWHSMSDPDDWYGFHLDHYTNPPDHGYQARDGALYFILRRGNTEDWDRLVLELGMEQVLADPRFTDYGRQATSIGRYAPEVKQIWEEAFKSRPREEIIALIKSIGGDAVPMMDYPSLVCHPQVEALGAIIEVPHPNGGTFKTIRPVARFAGSFEPKITAPPKLGQHTEEILDALDAA
jgi:crotonobetainyl-CoA:carnitine CoA-transferase CaiB-like acyl-CoA transferase